MDRWSKSKCLLGRRLEPICDSLEGLGAVVELGSVRKWDEVGSAKVSSQPADAMWGSLLDGASMGWRSSAGEGFDDGGRESGEGEERILEDLATDQRE